MAEFAAIAALASGGAQAYGAVKQGDAAYEQGQYQKRIADYNSKLAEEQAFDVIELGEKDVRQVGMAADKIVGSQRVIYAGSGVDVNEGTAADMQRDARSAASQDVLTIRNNAARSAMGYRVEAQNYTMQGRYAELSGINAKSNSIVTAGAAGLNGVLGAFEQFNKLGGSRSPGRVAGGSIGSRIGGGDY